MKTWSVFVADWIIEHRKWCKRVQPDGVKLGFLLQAHFWGLLRSEEVKAYFQ